MCHFNMFYISWIYCNQTCIYFTVGKLTKYYYCGIRVAFNSTILLICHLIWVLILNWLFKHKPFKWPDRAKRHTSTYVATIVTAHLADLHPYGFLWCNVKRTTGVAHNSYLYCTDTKKNVSHIHIYLQFPKLWKA